MFSCRAHLEEDAGKNMHGGTGALAGSAHSLIDLNRAGVPLLEIVTEPDFRSGAEAAAYGEELRRIVRFLGISDGNMSVCLLAIVAKLPILPVGVMIGFL
jgi:aspartyl-tRNA(Asn)/glutamyl-tRNA(Gln) amidotransferase subunit B